MASRRKTNAPLVVIAGPTASGKTTLAIKLAKKFDGEIICADSRTVYRDLNIGTAKPSRKEQELVPHWGLDLVTPGSTFTAADFKQYAGQKIEEIRARHKVPFLVGGTGLYIDAVLFDYQFDNISDSVQRAELEAMSLKELHIYCVKNNITLPENKYNKRYVIRAIEQKGINNKRRNQPIDNTVVVAIATEKEDLKSKITDRIEQIFAHGVVGEATLLGKKYGWNNEAMTGNIYPIIKKHLTGEVTLDEAKELAVIADWQLAKRQLTWLRRNPYVKWLSLSEAEVYIESILS